MVNLSGLHAKDVIIEDFLSEYEKGMAVFQRQLFQLSTTIYVLHQILNFPLELFVDSDKTIFFNLVIRNFFDAGLLIITRLATDQSDDPYTLFRFKHRVREMVKPELINLFDERLKKSRFDKRTTVMFEKARGLRNERVGHLDEDVVSGISEGVRLSYSEFKSLHKALISLLNTLSFNEDFVVLPAPYDPRVQHPVGKSDKTDIEELLDSVAMSSSWIKLPERNPNKWKYWRSKLTEDQVSQINRYRMKFDLPEA